MPTPTKGPRLGGSPAHQRLILSNLATSLFEHGRITTTEAKARRLRPYAEHLITKAKVDTVANRRLVVKVIRDKSVLHTLFTEIGPSMATRPGGYTRITKLGPRKGDNAPMAVIQIVESKDFASTGSTTNGATGTAASAVVAEDAADEAVDAAATAEDVNAETTDAEVSEETAVAEDAADDAVDAADVADKTDDPVEAEEAAEDAVDAAADAEQAAENAEAAADDTKA